MVLSSKDLIIRVQRWDGETEEYKYLERGNCSLELDPDDRWEGREHQDRDHDWDRDRDNRREDADEHHERELRILRAYYGVDGRRGV